MRALVLSLMLAVALSVVPSADARAAGCPGRAVTAVDPEVASHPRNRVEDAATPRHLACLSRTSFTLAPGRRLDPVRERLVLQVGDRLRVVRGLRQLGPRRWAFRGPATGAFAVRVGDDWGALDARGRRVVPEPVADTARAAAGTIGPGGGSVRATDAAGVVATLQVPAGALKRATTIRVVPLAGPAVPGGGLSQAGLRFEPAGLVFAHPALLTLDYSGTGHRVSARERISLVTSPLSALALPGSADPAARTVTGVMAHFSTTVGGVTAAQLSDLTAWADPILRAGARPTLSELVSAAALMAEQQRTGCVRTCIDAATLAARTEASLNGLTRECGLDIADPSDGAMERWLALAALAQSLNVDSGDPQLCAVRILEALVAQADELDRLVALAARAQRLGEDATQDVALRKVAALLREQLGEQRSLCGLDPDHARDRMADTLEQATLVAGVDAGLAADVRAAMAACARPSSEASTSDTATAPTPPPLPACAGDSDAARDAWRALELAGNASAHACVRLILDAQIAAAKATAQANRDSAAFGRLAALADWAQANDQPAAGLTARQGLGLALRALLETARAACATDPPAGSAGLTTVLAWAPAAAAADPALSADAVAALADCGSTALAVVMERFDGWYPEGNYCRVANAELDDWEDDGLAADSSDFPRTFAADKALAHGQSASIEMRLARPTPTTVTVDTTAATTPNAATGGSPFGECTTTLQLTATQPGTFAIDAGAAEPQLWYLFFELFDAEETWGQTYGTAGATGDGVRHIELDAPAGETIHARVILVNLDEDAAAVAAGRAATISFTAD